MDGGEKHAKNQRMNHVEPASPNNERADALDNWLLNFAECHREQSVNRIGIGGI